MQGQTVHRPLAAALWMTGSIASFSAMAVAGRSVAGVHDTFEIMTWRSVIGFLVVVSVALALGRLTEVRRDRLASHLLRNTFHFAGQNLWFWALTMIPLAQVFALEFTSPVWVILLAAVFLGERLTAAKALAAALGFAGILVVAQPDFAALDAGVVAAAASAVCFAATAILTKALTRGESIVSILFWLTLMQLGLGLVAAGWDGDLALPTAATLPWLALIGVCGLVAHFCLTTALSLAPASIVVPVDFARLPVIAGVGWLIYDERVGLNVWLGAALICAAILVNLRATRAASAQQVPRHETVTPRQ
ncbi:MAG: DMT family transporter [Paracoccaceae bacterium]|nr:MAG: DMT family transporter [Paracoccaceae bacterium]